MKNQPLWIEIQSSLPKNFIWEMCGLFHGISRTERNTIRFSFNDREKYNKAVEKCEKANICFFKSTKN